MRILVLRHVDCEPPAAYGPLLAARGTVETVRLGLDPLPEHEEFDAVVAMGGPMGVNDRGSMPWIADEVDYIARVVSAGTPYWGVCLGAQLLAAALGARVYTGEQPEVGMGTVSLTAAAAADPVFAGLPRSFAALHWHSDTFDLPANATLLASSVGYAHQAFRVGSAYGVQFHLETPPELAEAWLELPAYRQSLEAALGPDGPQLLLTGLDANMLQLSANAHTIMSRWLDEFVPATAGMPFGS